MSKKKFVLLGYFLSLLFIFVGGVNAVTGFNVTINGDEVTLSASHVYSFSYSVYGDTSKQTICTGLSDNANTAKCKISVKNGSYKFYANSRMAADGDPSDSTDYRTVTTSCSEQSKTGRTDAVHIYNITRAYTHMRMRRCRREKCTSSFLCSEKIPHLSV